MESKSFVVVLILLVVVVLVNSAAVDRELRKFKNRINNRMNVMQQNMNNMQENIADLEFENRELRKELESENNRTSELEVINNMQRNIQQNVVHFEFENRELRKELDRQSNRTSELEIKLDLALSRNLLATTVERKLEKIENSINNLQRNIEQNIVHFEFENRELRKELDRQNNRTSELGIKFDSVLSSSPAIADIRDSTVQKKFQRIEDVINGLAKDVDQLKSKSYKNTDQLDTTIRKAFVKEKALIRKLNETLRSKQKMATREIHDFISKSNKSLERHIEDIGKLYNTTSEYEVAITTKLDKIITAIDNTDVRISQNEKLLTAVSGECSTLKKEDIGNLHNTTSKNEEAILEITTKLDKIITAMANTDIRNSQNEKLLTVVSDCGSHKDIPDGHVSGDTSVGGTPVISCNTGYSQTGSAQCEVPVMWKTDVKCQKDCAILHVANGVVNPATSVPHSTTVTVTCNTDYDLVGTSTAVCNNGDFTGVPSCRRRTPSFTDCAILHVAKGMVNPATTVPHGTPVTVTCNSDYDLVGTSTAVCNNGDFTGVPSCRRRIPTFTDMVVGSSRRFNIRLDDDSYTPWITGAEFLSDGRLVLCDYNSHRLKLLSSDFSMLDSLLLQTEPRDVSAVNSTTVIVTLPDIKLLQYVHVLPHFSQSSKIQLDKKCLGVDVVGEEIFTSCFNSWDTYDGEVRVFDLGGSLKRQLGVNQDKSYMFKDPNYLTVSSNTGNIYVSDWDTDEVTCLSSAGDVIYQYDDPELDSPRGIYLDHADNIVVLGLSSHNAHVVTASNTKHRILLTSSDGLHRPYSVAYRQNDATLVIGSYGKNLLVFKLEN